MAKILVTKKPLGSQSDMFPDWFLADLVGTIFVTTPGQTVNYIGSQCKLGGTNADDKDLEVIDRRPDPWAKNPFVELSNKDMVEYLIRGLLPAEKTIIQMYYMDNLSMREVGEKIDISESRVCQIHKTALEMMKFRAELFTKSTT